MQELLQKYRANVDSENYYALVYGVFNRVVGISDGDIRNQNLRYLRHLFVHRIRAFADDSPQALEALLECADMLAKNKRAFADCEKLADHLKLTGFLTAQGCVEDDEVKDNRTNGEMKAALKDSITELSTTASWHQQLFILLCIGQDLSGLAQPGRGNVARAKELLPDADKQALNTFLADCRGWRIASCHLGVVKHTHDDMLAAAKFLVQCA